MRPRSCSRSVADTAGTEEDSGHQARAGAGQSSQNLALRSVLAQQEAHRPLRRRRRKVPKDRCFNTSVARRSIRVGTLAQSCLSASDIACHGCVGSSLRLAQKPIAGFRVVVSTFFRPNDAVGQLFLSLCV